MKAYEYKESLQDKPKSVNHNNLDLLYHLFPTYLRISFSNQFNKMDGVNHLMLEGRKKQ
mgnify:CR=1 FL=1